MKISVTIVALCALVGLAAGEGFAQVYCGRRLAETLGALCSNNYLAKRAGYELYGLAMEPWGARWAPTPLRGARNKRQVVSECCMKACTLDELLTYC